MNESDLRRERAARNQSLFRDVNGRLVGLNETFELLTDNGVFVCECAHMECIQEVDLTLEEYSRVRSNPRWFIVAPSEEHVVPDVERLVERHENYFVVEKIGVGAEVAEGSAVA